MSSVVIFRSDGVVVEWNKGQPYSLRAPDGIVRPYATEAAALAAAERKVRKLRKGARALAHPPVNQTEQSTMTTEYLVWHAFKETPATATRVQAPSSFEARKKRAAEAGVPYTELAARKWKPTASEQPQHVYEFDVKLFTRVTVTAASEAAARAMIPEMIDGEQDGDADLIEVDGKDVG